MPPTTRIALRCGLLGAFWTFPGSAPAREPTPPLVIERTIPLANVSGRVDHMAIDVRRGRLFVAELGNGTVDVVDIKAGKIIERLGGLKEPQGVGYAPGADMMAVASAGDGSVRLFAGETLTAAGRVSLGDDADDVRVDGRTGRFLVGYGSGGLAAIDPASRSVIADDKLAAHPESFQVDAPLQRVFVNVPDAGQVAVLAGGKQVATWRLPGLRGNFPMALDDSGLTLTIVFRSPARLVVLDARNGSVIAGLQTCRDADDVFLDAKRHLIYISCGEGLVDVVRQDASRYRLLADVKTAPGARTSLFVPELDRLFVAARAGYAGSGSAAAILVLRPQP